MEKLETETLECLRNMDWLSKIGYNQIHFRNIINRIINNINNERKNWEKILKH